MTDKIQDVDKIRVGMVGYYNTFPFLLGLEQSSKVDIALDVPSRCMDFLRKGQVDVALVPVVEILDNDNYEVITNYCIGCDGPVDTVCLLSNTPINEVNEIFLDGHSKTSQWLVKILTCFHWKKSVKYRKVVISQLGDIEQGQAVLMIGDKVFANKRNFDYVYDLGDEWKKMTGMPFVFAVWISHRDRNRLENELLNNLLSKGVKDIPSVIAKYSSLVGEIDLRAYYEENISYTLDERKRDALKLFFNFIRRLTASQMGCLVVEGQNE